MTPTHPPWCAGPPRCGVGHPGGRHVGGAVTVGEPPIGTVYLEQVEGGPVMVGLALRTVYTPVDAAEIGRAVSDVARMALGTGEG